MSLFLHFVETYLKKRGVGWWGNEKYFVLLWVELKTA